MLKYKLLNGDSTNPQVVPARYRDDNVIVRDDSENVYVVYADYKKLIDEMPPGAHYHEVIFGHRAQKLKFDFDAPMNEFESCNIDGDPLTEQTIIDTFKYTIAAAMYSKYSIMMDESHIIVCKNKQIDDAPSKCSLHFIVDDYAVESHAQAHEFMCEVLKIMPPEISQWVDRGVYKSTQNFRLPGAVRNGRIKIILTQHNALNCCIGYTSNCKLIGAISTPAPKVAPIPTADVEKVLEICRERGLLQHHAFRSYDNGILSFRRLLPSHCELCNRVHNNDNTLMVVLVPTTGAALIVQKCRHNDNDKRVLGEIPLDIDRPADNSRLLRAINGAKMLTPDIPSTVSKNVYNAPELADFELAPTVIVHAAMKMGKTKKLKQHIGKHYNDQSVIRFISFRQTFSNSIKSNFSDFDLYTDINGDINSRRVIIQVESLWRLICIDAPDLLVLDECESIFEQFDSGLGGQLGLNFATMQWLLRHSRRVILMDAYITNRSINIIGKMRGGEVVYHRNTFSRDIDIQFNFTVDQATWLSKLSEYVGAGKRIAIPVNSLTDGKSIQQFLIDKYPKINSKIYSSETLASEKREHFSDVNKYWQQYDVLIYTPTLTAGVSFEIQHFDYIFGAFSDKSCGAEVCMQMIGRVRNVICGQIYLYINASGNNLPDTRQQIANSLELRRAHMMRGIDTAHLSFEITATGSIKYHNTDYYTLWVENTLSRNLSKNYFLQRMINLCKSTCGKLAAMDVVEGEDTASGFKLAKRAVKANKYQAIAEAADIDINRAIKIQEDMLAKRDISADLMCSYEKYKLRADYQFNAPIDTRFVETFYEPQTRTTVKNLCKIMEGGDPAATLAQIHKEESQMHIKLMSEETTQYRDLRRTYMYTKHRIAIDIIVACGWKNPNDSNYIHVDLLQRNIRGAEEALRAEMKLACAEFDMRPMVITEDNYLRAWLKYMNTILGALYGVNIVVNRDDKSMYQLRRNVQYETLMQLKFK